MSKMDHEQPATHLPPNLWNDIVHSITLRCCSPMRAVCSEFKKAMPSFPCLDKYALAWSTKQYPLPNKQEQELEDLFYDSSKYSCSEYIGLTRIQNTDYLFQDQLWLNIIISDDLKAATILAQHLPVTVHENQNTTNSISTCALVCVQSLQMFQILEKYTDLNIQHDCVAMILHHINCHDSQNDGGRQFLKLLIQAGADLKKMAIRISTDNDLLTQLQRGLFMNQKSHPLVLEMNKADVLVEMCCRICADNMQYLGIFAFHNLIEQCTVDNEKQIIRVFQEHFGGDMDERNEENNGGKTVLEVLYAKRPLNRNILQVLNQWKHSDVEFFE